MSSFCVNHSTFNSPLHGNGVKAVVDIEDGSVIFTEKPYVLLQTLPNRQVVIACGECNTFLGSKQLQIDVLKRTLTRQNLLEANNEGIVGCSGACGEFYCSEQCREYHWEHKGHKLLCTGKLTEQEAETSPLIAYKMHAVETNEIFLMVAELFARMVATADNLVASGLTIEDALAQCTRPLSIYVRELWWNAAIPPARQKPVAFKNTLKRLVSDAWPLLDETLHITAKGFHTVLSAEYMARTIGMFEQNNVGVRMQSPLATYAAGIPVGAAGTQAFVAETNAILAAMDDGTGDCCEDEGDDENDMDEDSGGEEEGDEGDVEMAKCSGDEHYDALQALLEEEGADSLYPPLDGTAFYLLICQINHSCNPNVIVRYAVREQGLVAELHALRPIAAGEEFVQSYIDQSLPFKSRQKALAEYGFQCMCEKCVSKE